MSKKSTMYLIQVTTGSNAGDDFVGLYDLDGEKINASNETWVLARKAPDKVIKTIEAVWGDRAKTMVRID